MGDHQDIPRQLMAIAEEVASIRTQMAHIGYAFIAWGHALTRHAEAAYLAAHGRLPGAQTTARLLKKRQVRVWRWYIAQLEGVGHGQEGLSDG